MICAALCGYSEPAPSLLFHISCNLTRDSERALISLKVLLDFDSALREAVPNSRRNARQQRAFLIQGTVSSLPISPAAGRNCQSLWPHAEIFPFSGDGGRGLGSILTAWRPRQSFSSISPLIPMENRGSLACTAVRVHECHSSGGVHNRDHMRPDYKSRCCTPKSPIFGSPGQSKAPTKVGQVLVRLT